MTHTSTPPTPADVRGLRRDCLPFVDVFAQSIATIAPTVGPALTIALVHETAGPGTWLTYLVATVAMLLVGSSINVFARRSASPGALSDVVAEGLGRRAGVVAAWALCLAYLGTAMAVACGFANFMDVLLGPVTGPLPLVWELLAVGGACLCACRDVRLSTTLMLALEIGSLAAIVVLAVLVVLARGTLVDPAQLTLQGVTPGGVMVGLVLATLSFVGFESATTLGHEARDPLRTIPRAVTTSTLFSGVFYVIMSYVEVLGFSFLPRAMHASPAPLDELAAAAGVGFLGAAISVGAAVSMFACTLAQCVFGPLRVHPLVCYYFGSCAGPGRQPGSVPHLHCHERDRAADHHGCFLLHQLRGGVLRGAVYECGGTAVRRPRPQGPVRPVEEVGHPVSPRVPQEPSHADP